jgi:hypothetical protein
MSPLRGFGRSLAVQSAEGATDCSLGREPQDPNVNIRGALEGRQIAAAGFARGLRPIADEPLDLRFLESVLKLGA